MVTVGGGLAPASKGNRVVGRLHGHSGDLRLMSSYVPAERKAGRNCLVLI